MDLYIGVNCFILISGYYGVKLRWKNLLSLFIACAIYGVVGYLFHIWYDGASIGKSLICNSLLLFSHSSWWYINCYLILLLVSPLLNAGIERMSKHQHQVTIVGLTICQIYFGYFWCQCMFDDGGYSFMQFLYMYIIGAYIHKYTTPSKQKRNIYFWIYVICALIWGTISCLSHRYSIDDWWRPICYNNPIVVIAAVSFFLYFQTFTFTNKIINWLAPGTLAAYLIQDQYYFGSALYRFVHENTLTLSPYTRLATAVGISIVFLAGVMILDKGRIRMCTPIITNTAKKLDDLIAIN